MSFLQSYECSKGFRSSLLPGCLSGTFLNLVVVTHVGEGGSCACYRFTVSPAFRVVFTLCGPFACFQDVARARSLCSVPFCSCCFQGEVF